MQQAPEKHEEGLISDSDEEIPQLNTQKPQPSQKIKQNFINQDSDRDEEIEDLQPEILSEKSSSDQSIFHYEDEIKSESEKSEESEEEQRQLSKIIEDEERDEDFIFDQEQMEQPQKPLLKGEGPKVKVSLRDYQKTLFQKSQDKNSIIYLPTGLGKTRIAIASMYYYLSYTQKKKVAFLANTIQLVKQQAEAIKRTLYGIVNDRGLCKQINKKHAGNELYVDWDWEKICREVVCIHGQKNDEIGQTKKKKIQSGFLSKKEFLRKFQNSTIIVCISQMFLNCLRRGFINLTDFSFIVFDQCHHCKGDHPYSGIMNEFYFDIKKKMQKGSKIDKNISLPKLMGLTASPIPDPQKNQKKLEKMIQELCINLDSNFVEYPKGQSGIDTTKIDIIKIQETEQAKKDYPLLLNYFAKHFSHKVSYEKLQYYFPEYFKCIKEVVDLMGSRHECLKIHSQAKQITQAQLFFFYDIKECLLNKVKDLWLQLGEYVMLLAFGDLISQLQSIKGLKYQENQKLLKDIIQILLNYEKKLKIMFEFDKCSPKYYSAKLIKLIDLLTPQNESLSHNQKIGEDDSVLVFAFKRRTVEYLDKFFSKYKEKQPEQKKKYFQCTGVTGYSQRSFVRVLNQGISYETNPSSKTQQHKIDVKYQEYLQDYQDSLKSTAGATAALQNQLNRFRNAKIGKFLLQTEQKYSSQLRKITQFRKREKRVLISTSVTEQGFDIPGCNKVISFDTPFSMKAYIQIKGRARKKNSTYYIFTSEVNYEEMLQNKQIYDDTINATYEIAINRIAKKQVRAEKKKENFGYKKAVTKSGALLNTNYALEILKIYFTTLTQPNKGYFHYALTPNVCYKCIIKMPESDPSGELWFAGEAHSTKDLALKSAAYNAVKTLKKMGLIRDDLRPSRVQQLEDQFQLQKYDDLQMLKNDQDYKKIFQQYAQFEEQKQRQAEGGRNFLRIHFKAIRSEQLDFPRINPKFDEFLFKFKNKDEKFSFQLYEVRFSNTHNQPFLKEFSNSNEVGILTCFDQAYTDRLFSHFVYQFEDNKKESFSFKKIDTQLKLTYKEYQQLRDTHQFLVSSCANRQILYYIDQEGETMPQNSQWRQIYGQASERKNNSRQFYPLLVLLKVAKKEKDKKIFEIDYNRIQKIKCHNKLFKELYLFYNKPKNVRSNQRFPQDLTQQYENFVINLKGNQTLTLVQSITLDFLFHKCLVIKTSEDTQSTINQSKKSHATKDNLQKRKQKYEKIFQHFKSEKNDLIQRQLWRTWQKDKKLSFFDQVGIKQQKLKNQRFYYLKQFVEYPISPQTLFKLSLAKKYVYDALNSYTKALSFVNIKLTELFEKKNKKEYSPMEFKHYDNILMVNSDVIFEHLADYGRSKILRDLGKSYQSNKISQIPEKQLNKSLIPNISQISGIEHLQVSMSKNYENSISFLNSSKIEVNDQTMLSANKRIYNFDKTILNQLKITDIQKVLTAKSYKFQRGENYEEFQFMGDVVLKYLATLEVFCTRPTAVEGEMHIARANIICNANLHKKAIGCQFFRYIMASKNLEPCPPYKINYDENKVERQKYLGKGSDYQFLGIYKVNKASAYEGYQYIPGKAHADVAEALIGAFYYTSRNLSDCQQLLYVLDILKCPSLNIQLSFSNSICEGNLPKKFVDLEQEIKYTFRHKGLMIQALTHPTFRNTLETVLDDRNMSTILQTSRNQHSNMSLLTENVEDYRTKIKFHETFYERLEFLGDSVLDLIVVEHLYDKYGRGLDEGTLSMLKQAGVSNKTLGLIAVKFKLDQLTLMDIPELQNLQKQFSKLRRSFDQYVAHPQKLQSIQITEIKLLGDVFEGLIGAILIDNDFDYNKTKTIVWKIIGQYIEIFTNKDNIKGISMTTFLTTNNYQNCRIQKITPQLKNGKFHYGLLDRKLTVIETCYADNQKDAWDIIIEKCQARQNGIVDEDK